MANDPAPPENEQDVLARIVPLMRTRIKESFRMRLNDASFVPFQTALLNFIQRNDAAAGGNNNDAAAGGNNNAAAAGGNHNDPAAGGNNNDADGNLYQNLQHDPVKMVVMAMEELFEPCLLEQDYNDFVSDNYPMIKLTTMLGRKPGASPTNQMNEQRRIAQAAATGPHLNETDEGTFLHTDGNGVEHTVKRDPAGHLYYVESKLYIDLPPVSREKTFELGPRYFKQFAKRRKSSIESLARAEFEKYFGKPKFPNSALKLAYLKNIGDHKDHWHPYHILSSLELLLFGAISFDKQECDDNFEICGGYHGQRMENILKKYKEYRPDFQYQRVPTLYQEFCNGKALTYAPPAPYLIVGGVVMASGYKYFFYHPPTATIFPSENGLSAKIGSDIRHNTASYDSSLTGAILRQVWPTETHEGKTSTKDECKVETLPAFFVYR